MKAIDNSWRLLGARRTEQRRHVRFRFTAPVRFSWRVGKAKYEGVGVTRDMSSHGIFVLCDLVTPPADSSVNLDVSLSSPDAPKAPRLWATGHIVRIERGGKNAGFAAAATFKRATASIKTEMGAYCEHHTIPLSLS